MFHHIKVIVALLSLIACTASSFAQEGRSTADQLPQGWQIRGGHNGNSNDMSMLPVMARLGINSIFVSNSGHLLDDQFNLSDRLDGAQLAVFQKWQEATHALGMQYFPVVELYGTGDRKRWALTRTFVNREGTRLASTPCPADPQLWRNKLTRYFVEIARWARQQPNVPGILLEAEMYGADHAGFVDACYCPECREDIAARLGVPPQRINLDSAEMLQRYHDVSTQIIQELATELREAVRAEYPDCLLGSYILDYLHGDDENGTTPPFYKGVTLGWGTPENPVLALSEATYAYGYHTMVKDGKALQGDRPSYIKGWQARWKSWGAHAEMVVGNWIQRAPPENIAETLYYTARDTRGYWIYDVMSLGGQTPPVLLLPGNDPSRYFDAIALANAELDRWLESGGSYESNLVVRPFTVPAPGVPLETWQAVDLPRLGAGTNEPAFLVFPDHAFHYIPASQGERMELRIAVDSAHPTKKKVDAVAIVVLDPAGKIILEDKVTYDDLDTTPGEHGRYAGRKIVQFDAPQTGTYCLIVKGVRYACGLGASTHPWAAAIHVPLNLFQPKELYVRSVTGAQEVALDFAGASRVQVYDLDGRALPIRIESLAEGGERVIVLMPRPGVHTLRIKFQDKTLTARLIGFSNLEPWMTPSAQAPFPEP